MSDSLTNAQLLETMQGLGNNDPPSPFEETPVGGCTPPINNHDGGFIPIIDVQCPTEEDPGVSYQLSLEMLIEAEENKRLAGEEEEEVHTPPLTDIRDDSRGSAESKCKSALAHLNYFLKNHYNKSLGTNKRDYVPAEELTYNPQNKEDNEWWDDMIGKFLTYLSRYATRYCKKGGVSISHETGTGYASAIKAYFDNKFRSFSEIPVFRPSNWSKLRRKLQAAFVERHKLSKTRMSNPHKASTDEDRISIAIGCVYMNDPLSAEFLHLNNTMFQCVGRGSEVASIQVADLSTVHCNEFSSDFHVVNCFLKKDKQGTEQDLKIFPHRDSWHQDWYFSSIYHLLMGSGGNDGSPFIFPSFAQCASNVTESGRIESKVSSKFTEVFKEIQHALTEICGCFPVCLLSSHHCKKGGNYKMGEEPTVSGLAQIFRSGWIVRGLHSLFDYVMGTPVMMTAAGKVLANWTTKCGGEIIGGNPPNLDDIHTKPELLDGFVDCIFQNDVTEMWPRHIRYLLVGALLRHYDEFCGCLSAHPKHLYDNLENHLFISKVKNALRSCGVDDATFDAWKEEVGIGFWSRNCQSLVISRMPAQLLDGSPHPSRSVMMDPRCFMDHFNDLARSMMTLQATQRQLVLTLNRSEQRQLLILDKLAQISSFPGSSPVVLVAQQPDQEMEDSAAPPPVIRYTVAEKGWGKVKNVEQYFFHFFNDQAMEGYQFDLEDPQWATNPDTSKIRAKFGRLKKVIKIMLAYADTYPPPKPRQVANIAAWQRAVRDIAAACNARILQKLNDLSNSPTIKTQLSQAALIAAKEVHCDEDMLPDDTPIAARAWFTLQATKVADDMITN